MKSVMTHQFSRVPNANIERSVFDRSHGHKTAFDAGYLIPIYVDEALPGDTFSLNMSFFARLATPQKPIMDNMFLESFFFAVPVRLVWQNWKKFMGEKDDPDDTTVYQIPQIGLGTEYVPGSIYDYMGLPMRATPTAEPISALPFRAYQLIWNDWFRAEQLQEKLYPLNVDDGPDISAEYGLRRRNKRHDYFTSCLPWPQAGEDVLLPLGDSAPVVSNGISFDWKYPDNSEANVQAGGTGTSPAQMVRMSTGPADALFHGMRWGDPTGLEADLSTATQTTVNALRQSIQLQKMLERDARGGTRYVEIIKSHFGVTSPDFRQQRPEYLGGGSSRINIHPVPQTSQQTLAADWTDSPQGNLAAFGTGSGTGHGFRKSFTEHCILIGLVSVRADLTYQEGIDRMWSRLTKYDFYWPTLSHLGEQAVLNKEIWFSNNHEIDNSVFGYQERFAEYRYKNSLITGIFRSSYATTLDFWHLSQSFGSLPELNSTFIEENPPIDRVITVPSEPHFLFDSYFQLKCARPMPVYSVPGLLDHF